MDVTIGKRRRVSAHRVAISLSDKVLEDFISGRKEKSLKDLKGKISFREDYDYKSMRS